MCPGQAPADKPQEQQQQLGRASYVLGHFCSIITSLH